MILFALLPASAQPYAKAVVAALGLILQAAIATIPGIPDGFAVAAAFLTALGVLAQPNAEVEIDRTPGRHEAL